MGSFSSQNRDSDLKKSLVVAKAMLEEIEEKGEIEDGELHKNFVDEFMNWKSNNANPEETKPMEDADNLKQILSKFISS